MGFVACNSDDDENSEVNDKSPAEAIDLGLPSGTLWASCNVGATKPEEYGDYFAWGEITPKENYSESTYKWCNGDLDKLTKYNANNSYGTVDNKTELELTDDAAYMNWGGRWRMPSLDQIKELLDNCDWEWTKLNGVRGQKATSKKNGNTIFFPAADYYAPWGIPDVNNSVYACGEYWSRTLCTSYSDSGYGLRFDTSTVPGTRDVLGWDDCPREFGLSIRPVRMK